VPGSGAASAGRSPALDPTRLSGPSSVPPPVAPRRFHSLASRLVALGVLQLALLVGIGVVSFMLAAPRAESNPRDYLTPAMVARLEQGTADPATLEAVLEELRENRIEASIYDRDRTLLASNVEPALAIPKRGGPPGMGRGGPLPDGPGPGERGPGDRGPPEMRHMGEWPPPVPPDGFKPRDGKPRAFVAGIQVKGERGYLVARGTFGEPPGLIGPILTLVLSFIILVASALLTARWIVRPIDRLSRTAKALGRGDLAARSRLARSDEIGELGHRIDEMADRIAGLIGAERELMANVAHELRTPLSRIGVALDLASEGDMDMARASLAEIAVDVGELETIVDDILTATRFEVAGATGLPVRKAVVTPGSIAEAAADRLRSRHPERPLDVTIAPDLPSLHVDPMLVRRIVDNLLENAHKYSPDRTATMELAVRKADGGVEIEVKDRGAGIPADDLPHVFTAFFRGDKSRSRETGGVGLGLTLAKRIAEAHGGTITIESTVGVGTTVRLVLPAAA